MCTIRKTTTGKKGVWVYKIGSSKYFSSIIRGTVAQVSEEQEDATELPLTTLPRQTEKEEPVFATYGPQEETTEEDKFTTETTSKIPTEYPTSSLVTKTTTIIFTEMENRESIQVVTKYPESMSAPTPTDTYPGWDETSEPTPSEPQYFDEVETTNAVFQPSEPITTIPDNLDIPETPEPRLLPVAPSLPESDPTEHHYTSPDQVQQVPPYSRSHQPQIVVVDEDEDLNVDGK